MPNLSRREWHGLVLGGLGSSLLPRSAFAAGKIDSTVKGVRLGAQSYSFRDRAGGRDRGHESGGVGRDRAVAGTRRAAPRRQPPRRGGAQAPAWRGAQVPPGDAARPLPGDRGQVQGRRHRPLRLQLQLPRRLHGRGDRPRIRDGQGAGRQGDHRLLEPEHHPPHRRRGQEAQDARRLHNPLARQTPTSGPTAEDFEKAMAKSSGTSASTSTAATSPRQPDAVAFLQKHHQRIVTLHIKDRKRNEGETVPFGQGDAPIKEVLFLLSRNRWAIPAKSNTNTRATTRWRRSAAAWTTAAGVGLAASADRSGRCLALSERTARAAKRHPARPSVVHPPRRVRRRDA